MANTPCKAQKKAVEGATALFVCLSVCVVVVILCRESQELSARLVSSKNHLYAFCILLVSEMSGEKHPDNFSQDCALHPRLGVKNVGGAEAWRVCAICCRAGDACEFKNLKVISQLCILRADRIDKDIFLPFADPRFEYCRTQTTVNGNEYALDPRFVSNPERAPNEPMASVCETCSVPILARSHEIPQYSIGDDFHFNDLRIFGLEPPDLGEQVLMAATHLFRSTMKRKSVTGHFVSSAHITQTIAAR